MDNKNPQAAECTPGKMSKVTKHGRNRDGCRVQISLSSVVHNSLSVWGKGVQENFTVSLLLSLLRHLPAGQTNKRMSSTSSCLYIPCFQHPHSCQSPITPQNSALRVFCQGASSGCHSGLGLSWVILPDLLIGGLSNLRIRTASCLLLLCCVFYVPNTKRGVVGTQEHLHGSINYRINV